MLVFLVFFLLYGFLLECFFWNIGYVVEGYVLGLSENENQEFVLEYSSWLKAVFFKEIIQFTRFQRQIIDRRCFSLVREYIDSFYLRGIERLWVGFCFQNIVIIIYNIKDNSSSNICWVFKMCFFQMILLYRYYFGRQKLLLRLFCIDEKVESLDYILVFFMLW